jgi:hypothetical protein
MCVFLAGRLTFFASVFSFQIEYKLEATAAQENKKILFLIIPS